MNQKSQHWDCALWRGMQVARKLGKQSPKRANSREDWVRTEHSPETKKRRHFRKAPGLDRVLTGNRQLSSLKEEQRRPLNPDRFLKRQDPMEGAVACGRGTAEGKLGKYMSWSHCPSSSSWKPPLTKPTRRQSASEPVDVDYKVSTLCWEQAVRVESGSRGANERWHHADGLSYEDQQMRRRMAL